MLAATLSEVSGRTGVRTEAGGNLLCFFTSNPDISKGEIITAETSLRQSPELAAALEAQDVSGLSMLKAPAALTAFPELGAMTRLGYSSAVLKLRASVLSRMKIRCSRMGEDAGGLLLALLIGQREGLSAEENRIFREAGCSHILALSGMHLGILSGIILLLLRPLPGRIPAFIISSVIVFLYIVLAGFGTSLVRAALMYFLFGLSRAFYRKTTGLDVLLLSFVILTAADPPAFYSLSFQLSFLAVGGIILLSPEINRLLKSWLPAGLRLPLAVSASAQLFVLPLLLWTFGVYYPAGLVAGIIMTPLVTLFIWAGLFFLLTGLSAVSIFSDLIYKAICRTAYTAAAVPSISFEESAFWFVPLVAGLTILLAVYSIRRRSANGISG